MSTTQQQTTADSTNTPAANADADRYEISEGQSADMAPSETSSNTTDVQSGTDEAVQPQASLQQGDKTSPPKTEAQQKTEKPPQQDDDKQGNRVPARQRINELTKKFRTAEAENEKLRAELSTYKQGQQQQSSQTQQQQQAPSDPPKPKRDDFDSYDDFTEALTDWKLDQRERAKQSPTKQSPANQPPQNDQQQHPLQSTAQQPPHNLPPLTPEELTLAETIKEVAAEATTKFPDFAQRVLMDTTAVITPVMAESIFDSDHAADMAYYLATNREAAIEIASMPSAAQIRAIGRLEAKIESGALIVSAAAPSTTQTAPAAPANPSGPAAQTAQNTQQTQQRQVSKAPEPIDPENASGDTNVVDLDDMSMSDFAAKRRKAWAQRGY